MSQATKTVRAMYGAFERGDVEAVIALLHPEVRWVTPPTLPWSRGEYVGREGVGAYFGSFASALEDACVEPQEMLDCGGRVVALGEERATVRATGGRFSVPFAHAIRVSDRQVTELRGHVDTAAIVAAFAPTRPLLAQREAGSSAR